MSGAQPALWTLSTKVVSAKAPRPSGAGSAIGRSSDTPPNLRPVQRKEGPVGHTPGFAGPNESGFPHASKQPRVGRRPGFTGPNESLIQAPPGRRAASG